MEWSWFDPERRELTKWWTINPQTGQRNSDVAADTSTRCCLGDSALDDVAVSADAIATAFTTKHFTDGELSALFTNRIMPSSFKGGADDAAELLGLIDGLWKLAEQTYQAALKRLPGETERRWLCAFALQVIRARQNAA